MEKDKDKKGGRRQEKAGAKPDDIRCGMKRLLCWMVLLITSCSCERRNDKRSFLPTNYAKHEKKGSLYGNISRVGHPVFVFPPFAFPVFFSPIFSTLKYKIFILKCFCLP